MDSRVRTIAIVAAMASELKPVRRALGLTGAPAKDGVCDEGWYKGVRILTVVTNMGLCAAQTATEQLFARYADEIGHLFVVGIAGAVDADLDIGAVVIPESVVDERDGIARYPVNLSDRESAGVIYSTDQLQYDKAFVTQLHARKVSLVDMESGAIAAVCERHHCPFTVIRAVSDRVDKHAQDFDVFHLANADGSPRYGAAIRYILAKPWKIAYLIAMGLGAQKAINASSSELLKRVEHLLLCEWQ